MYLSWLKAFLQFNNYLNHLFNVRKNFFRTIKGKVKVKLISSLLFGEHQKQRNKHKTVFADNWYYMPITSLKKYLLLYFFWGDFIFWVQIISYSVFRMLKYLFKPSWKQLLMHSYLLQKLRTASISIFHKFSQSREKNHNNNLTQDIFFRLQDLKSRAHKIHEYFERNMYVLNVQLYTIEDLMKT